MRILVGWLLLLSAFAAAGLLQHRWSGDLRRQRASRADASTAVSSRPFLAPTGRAQLVLGRPSGAEALEVVPSGRSDRFGAAPPTGRETPGAEAGEPVPALSLGSTPELTADWPEGEAPPSWTPPVYELTVPSGAVLSRICQDFYGTGRPPIPARVAEYNGLRSADHVRAGDRLKLPPLEVLGLELREPHSPGGEDQPPAEEPQRDSPQRP